MEPLKEQLSERMNEQPGQHAAGGQASTSTHVSAGVERVVQDQLREVREKLEQFLEENEDNIHTTQPWLKRYTMLLAQVKG
jgi:gas vesicle protein